MRPVKYFKSRKARLAVRRIEWATKRLWHSPQEIADKMAEELENFRLSCWYSA
jgi:hypothetical protein